MAQPRVLVLRSPGTNCDAETAYAFEMAGARASHLHINELRERPELLDGFEVVCFPGGFSYGDDLSAGQILALQVKSRLFDRLSQFPEQDKLILGICNGFQVLVKTGLIFSADDQGFPATLTWNTNGRYTDRWVRLVPGNSECVFLKDVEQMYLPIAHGEGRFVARNEATLAELNSEGQFALRYFSNGTSDNPNGSALDIAGLCDPSGRIFGLMPHPERHIHPTQHPRWTREGLSEHPDGRAIFENAVAFFA
jgi:phosphoribosylformylglycinamidine synthase subunit PurQ / glutaminase